MTLQKLFPHKIWTCSFWCLHQINIEWFLPV
jgi:hypothetical protein